MSNYFKSIRSAEEIGVKRSLPWSYYAIAELYFQEANYDSALFYYNQTVSTAKALKIDNSAVTSAHSRIYSIKERDFDSKPGEH